MMRQDKSKQLKIGEIYRDKTIIYLVLKIGPCPDYGNDRTCLACKGLRIDAFTLKTSSRIAWFC